MGNGLHEAVPMTVHQAVNLTSRGLGQVRIQVGRLSGVLHLSDVHHFGLVGGELELGDTSGDIAHLTCARAVGLHRPDLAVTQIENHRAVSVPAGIVCAGCEMRDLPVVTAVGVHHVQLTHAAVLLDAGVGHSVEYLLAVG